MPDHVCERSEWFRANLRPTSDINRGVKKNARRTERRVVAPCDVAFCAGYHDRFVRAVDVAVHVHTLEGITVLRRSDDE